MTDLYPVRKNLRNTVLLLSLLATSIAVTNSLIIFASDEDKKFYFARLTTTITSAAALATAVVMVYKFKTKQKQSDSYQFHKGDDKLHFSICLFLALWFVAHLIWSFYEQQLPVLSIDDVLWLLGYALFGYFLYKLVYSFRKVLEAQTIGIIAIIVIISLSYTVLLILSASSLLSFQKEETSVMILTLVYPILDAVLLVPAVLIFWIGRSTVTLEHKALKADQRQNISWILLSLSMILFAIADSGFAYISASNLMTVQKEVWIWNIFYNCGYITLAGALTGYSNFFTLTRRDVQN